jgi:hypothetical protein
VKFHRRKREKPVVEELLEMSQNCGSQGAAGSTGSPGRCSSRGGRLLVIRTIFQKKADAIPKTNIRRAEEPDARVEKGATLMELNRLIHMHVMTDPEWRRAYEEGTQRRKAPGRSCTRGSRPVCPRLRLLRPLGHCPTRRIPPNGPRVSG